MHLSSDRKRRNLNNAQKTSAGEISRICEMADGYSMICIHTTSDSLYSMWFILDATNIDVALSVHLKSQVYERSWPQG